MTSEKFCTKCKTLKSVDSFSKQKSAKDGLQTKCKQCARQYDINNREAISKRQKRYRMENIDRITVNDREYYLRNREVFSERNRKYREENKDLIVDYKKDYYARNKEGIRVKGIKYRKQNSREIAKRKREYYLARCKKDPQFDLISRIRRRMLHALSRGRYTKSKRTLEALGCTALEFADHIERQFTRGMNWNNRRQWHLDHIVPISSAKTEEEIYALSHFTNIRPMWAKDNMRKSNQATHLI